MNALIKLCTGEELIANIVEFKDHLRLVNPVVVVRRHSDIGPIVFVAWWLTFLKDQTIDIERNKIVVFKYGLDDNAERHYHDFVTNSSPIDFDHETVQEKNDHSRSDIERAQTTLSNLIRGASSNTTIH